jgi:MFS transporter, FHS family, glucose/mannose:H+ symporter
MPLEKPSLEPADSSPCSEGFSRAAVLAACFLAILLFGVGISLLGAVLPSLMDRFHLHKAEAGTLFTWMSMGALLGSLLFGPVVDRYGYKILLMICCSLMLVGLELLAWAPAFFWVAPAILLVGLGGGVINGGTSALVADISSEGRSSGLSLLGVFFGLGAFGTPLLYGSLSSAVPSRDIIAVTGAILLAPILFLSILRFPPPKKSHGLPAAEVLTLTREPLLLLLGAMLFFQSGMEMTVGGWSATLFTEKLHLESARAVVFLSLYWLAMMVVRILLPLLMKKISSPLLLSASMACTLAGSVLLFQADTLKASVLGLVTVGAGLSSVFPLVLGLVGDRYSSLSGTAFSICLVMALSGGMTLPYLTGILGDSFGVKASQMIVPAALVLQALVFAVVSKFLFRPRRSRPGPI